MSKRAQADILFNTALPHKRDERRDFVPGDALILSGPARGVWADSLPRRPWVVVECSCGLCAQKSHVAVDVATSPAMLELYPDMSEWRHISSSALRRRGEISRERAEVWADYLGCDGGQSMSWQAEDGRHQIAKMARLEFANIALADALGGLELTEDQARQLEWRRDQNGGELTPEQVEQLREWKRERGAL